MPTDEKWYSIKVAAIVSLLPTSDSGRVNGITSGYRPNHNFGGPSNDEMRMGQLTVENDEWIQPGETKLVEVHFIMPEGYVVELNSGLKWRIQEASRLVGHGEIVHVISSDVPAN